MSMVSELLPGSRDARVVKHAGQVRLSVLAEPELALLLVLAALSGREGRFANAGDGVSDGRLADGCPGVLDCRNGR